MMQKCGEEGHPLVEYAGTFGSCKQSDFWRLAGMRLRDSYKVACRMMCAATVLLQANKLAKTAPCRRELAAVH
jgi:hypothetical protein